MREDTPGPSAGWSAARRQPGTGGCRGAEQRGRQEQHILAFEQGMLMREKMINICIHGFSFHLLVLYSGGAFSSW